MKSRPPSPFEAALEAPCRRLFVFFVLVYLLTAAGKVFNSDGGGRLEVLDRMVRYHTVTVPAGIPGRDGPVSPWTPGQPLAALPLVLPAYALSSIFPQLPLEPALSVCYSSLNQGIVAALGATIYVAARTCSLQPHVAVSAALLHGLATMAWQQSKDTFEQPQVALLMLWVLLLATGPAPATRRTAGLAGALFGLACLTRPQAILYAPVVLWVVWRRTGRDSPPSLLLAGLGALPFWLGLLAYNHARFGHPLAVGLAAQLPPVPALPPTAASHAAELVRRLGELLVGAQKGLFVYSPALLLGLAGAFSSTTAPLVRPWLAVGLTDALFHTIVGNWGGGWCWSARYVFSLCGPLAILAAVVSQRAVSRPSRLVVASLIALSTSVQILSVAVSYRRSFYEDVAGWEPGAHAGQYRTCLLAGQLDTFRLAIRQMPQALAGRFAVVGARAAPAVKLARDLSLNSFDLWWWSLAVALRASPVASRLSLLAAAILALLALLALSRVFAAVRRDSSFEPGASRAV